MELESHYQNTEKRDNWSYMMFGTAEQEGRGNQTRYSPTANRKNLVFSGRSLLLRPIISVESDGKVIMYDEFE
jgi:hypothetical protein